MVDFNIKDTLKDGLSFKKVFGELLLYSISLFLAFMWKSLFDETMAFYIPAGQGLPQKFIINIFVTVIFVSAIYFYLHKEKQEGSKP